MVVVGEEFGVAERVGIGIGRTLIGSDHIAWRSN